MDLFRLFAFTVQPSRTTATATTSDGGPIEITPKLRSLIHDSIQAADFPSRLSVVFAVDQTTRTNQVRDAVLSVAFASSEAALSSAKDLAAALSAAMDRRSYPCLFIIAGLREEDRRIVTLWTFPRDEAFRFASEKGAHLIELLTDIFSRTSHMRKAALFEGRDLRNEFATAKALDFQAGKTADTVANYWIVAFLSCCLAIASETGTRLLARTIAKAYDSCHDSGAREQLFVAMMAVRTSPRSRWSLDEFARQYLCGDAITQFLKAAPNRETVGSPFDLDRSLFEQTIKYRVFQLDTGVYVSSPPSEVGRSVNVSQDEQQLKCEGKVMNEKLRVKHA